jgi:hypothetical protein
MDDGDSKNNQQIKRQTNKDALIQRHGLNVSSILQSVWIRCRSVFPTVTDRKFMESELRVVLYCGVFFWVIYLLYETFK